jgi:hypothetical protein
MGVWALRFEGVLSQFCRLVALLSQGSMPVRISIIQIVTTLCRVGLPVSSIHRPCPLLLRHRCGTVCAVAVENDDKLPDIASIDGRFPPSPVLS